MSPPLRAHPHTSAAVAAPLSLGDRISATTQALGAILASIGLGVLVHRASGDPLKGMVFALFMGTLALHLSVSAALHGLPLRQRVRSRLEQFDRTAVFLLLATALTPVCLLSADQNAGLLALTVIWVLAGISLGLKRLWAEAPRWVSTFGLILATGFSLLAVRPLVPSLPGDVAHWLVLGAKCYLVGSLFYAFRCPNPIPGVLGHHELLHFFVLAGSACHFMMMLGYVT